MNNTSKAHRQIREKYGKADICEKCNSTESVQWSNINHKYLEERRNWQKLCRNCHSKFDTSIKKKSNSMKRQEDKRKYISSAEVAEIFGVEDITVTDWARTGKIIGIQIGSRWFFPKDRYVFSDRMPLKCATCDNLIKSADDFKDNLSRKEFGISGMCQSCQNKVFNGGTE